MMIILVPGAEPGGKAHGVEDSGSVPRLVPIGPAAA
jgi:hypothetical protein